RVLPPFPTRRSSDLAAVTNSAGLLKIFVPTGLIGSLVLQPVLAARLSGFQSVSGLPTSWTGRLQNLQAYFWPQLLSDWNFLLGRSEEHTSELQSRFD